MADQLDRIAAREETRKSDEGVIVMTWGDGSTATFPADARASAKTGAKQCRDALAAIETGDPVATASAMYELIRSFMGTRLAGLVKPVRAGMGTMKNSGRKADHDAAEIEQELDRQYRLHPNWGIQALREAAGEKLGSGEKRPLGERQIRRITKYDPRK